jgi:hypothetical protein
MSTWERMQLLHIFAGFGGMLVPQRQHSTVPGSGADAKAAM